MIHLLLYVKRTMRVPSHFPVCSSFRACSHFEITSQICDKENRFTGKYNLLAMVFTVLNIISIYPGQNICLFETMQNTFELKEWLTEAIPNETLCAGFEKTSSLQVIC